MVRISSSAVADKVKYHVRWVLSQYHLRGAMRRWNEFNRSVPSETIPFHSIPHHHVLLLLLSEVTWQKKCEHWAMTRRKCAMMRLALSAMRSHCSEARRTFSVECSAKYFHQSRILQRSFHTILSATNRRISAINLWIRSTLFWKLYRYCRGLKKWREFTLRKRRMREAVNQALFDHSLAVSRSNIRVILSAVCRQGGAVRISARMEGILRRVAQHWRSWTKARGTARLSEHLNLTSDVSPPFSYVGIEQRSEFLFAKPRIPEFLLDSHSILSLVSNGDDVGGNSSGRESSGIIGSKGGFDNPYNYLSDWAQPANPPPPSMQSWKSSDVDSDPLRSAPRALPSICISSVGVRQSDNELHDGMRDDDVELKQIEELTLKLERKLLSNGLSREDKVKLAGDILQFVAECQRRKLANSFSDK